MKVKKLTGFGKKAKGLMFRKNISPVYFETRWGIHTFFVPKPIDLVVLDGNYKVVKIVKSLKPFRLLFWNLCYKRVLELPEGFVEQNGITLGMRIIFNGTYISLMPHPTSSIQKM